MGSLLKQSHVSSVCLTEKIGNRGGGVEGLGLSEEEGVDVNGGGRQVEEDEVLVVNNYTTSLKKHLAPPPPSPVLAVPPPKPQRQQAPHGPLVRWERFLPLQSLKVLLVENDDSTRQVLSALLRNCSYEVTATANALEAWKVLENLTNHVDLVLTEVVIPFLSGIGLLSKIMNHKTCKNIPVIMMSSHDSMGIVFKCLSRGAVDFLVKPIRKNELKNLWQHVWRRCHSSSDSGSESGVQTQKSVKSKCVEYDNTGSNSEDDNTSTGLNIGVGSDNGSGTQSSWTKCAEELECPQPISPTDQLADPPNSTCAQVIHSKAEAFCDELASMAGNMDEQEKKIPEGKSMSKDSKMGEHRNPKSLIDHYPNGNDNKVPPNMVESLKERISTYEKENPQQSNDLLNPGVSKLTIEPSSRAIDHIGVVGDVSNSQALPKVVLNDTHVISESNDKASDGAEEFPFLELGLNRLSSSRNGGTVSADDQSGLRHSYLSAFSRYNTSAASNQTLRGCGGSCSFPVESSSGTVKVESFQNPISTSNVVRPNKDSNRNCIDDDIGSTIVNSFAKPTLHVKLETISAIKGTHSSTFHPVPHRFSATQVRQEKIDDLMGCQNMIPPRGVHCQVKVQQQKHYRHHQVLNMQQQQLQQQNAADQDDFGLKITSSAARQCGSSNLFSGPMECNTANYSVNGSVSGSNYGSNAYNGSSAAVNTGGFNVDSDSRIAVKSEAGDGSGSGSGSGVDENQFTQREAALNKFRQKRKERCFEKKVRYQSRKRLAEQRPRVHGQFVRQAVGERKGGDADC